jgi:hypothetical protein
MGDVLSIIAIALLLTVLVMSVRKQRATAADERAHVGIRAGADGAQYERSMANRAAVRQAHLDSKEHAAHDG